MNNIRRIAIKELLGFFSSLTAFLFFGAFLAVTLFIFFWVDAFFARNIADVRPMFEWMPVLLIFLVPSLTMRMWSEERRAGTIEFLLTMPVSNLELVLGKFAACMGLIVTALLLTLPIPITVSLLLGQLDWGPVIGGYLAALFLAASYTAIGLTISARTDNQIVSLLLSVLVCGLFLLIGSDGVTNLFNSNIGEMLKLFGSGSRFQSITRGVIDFRDLYYYISITGIFLSLNVLELERLRWSGNRSNPQHTKWLAITGLCILNFIAGNFWLQQISWARADMTEGRIYSISPATRKYIARLNEPLLIRGYFSKKSHPLLQPLVPKLRDLLKEYAVAGRGKVRVEFIDPQDQPEIEKEAIEKYGIKPAPFQTASKYQAALTNSYFDILIKYGDQFQKLSWKDLIEIKALNENDVSVDLRNPEYDITSTIKKALYSYQGTGNLFLSIDRPLTFTVYSSPDSKLPPPLLKLKTMLVGSLESLKKQANGKLSVEFVDPEADGGKVAKRLESDYGLRPMAIGLLPGKTFWFYMTIKDSDQVVQVPLPEVIQRTALDRTIQSGLKRFSKGFLKTIGFYAPGEAKRTGTSAHDFTTLRQRLSDAYTVESVSLESGAVPSEVDLLLVVAPDHLREKQVFAIDQFLMKGGTVILATSPFDVTIDKGMTCEKIESGLDNWLKSYGIVLQKTMVLDRQNFPLPIPITRKIAGFKVQETSLVPYPYFIDIRSEGMKKGDGITSGLNQVIMNWASPIEVDQQKNKQRHVLDLLESSAQSWTSDATKLEPRYSAQQPFGFPIGEDRGHKVLASAVEGSFESYYKSKMSPVRAERKDNPDASQKTEPEVGTVIDKSPDNARIILFASNLFLSDKMLWLASDSLRSRYLKPVELIQNAADWSLEDRDLLSIRGRGHFVRTLKQTTPRFDMFFEYLNYGLAIAGLGVIWLVRRFFWMANQQRFEELLHSLPEPSTAEEVKA